MTTKNVKVFQLLEANFLFEKGLDFEKFFVIFKAYSPTINFYLNFLNSSRELGWADVIIALQNFRNGRDFKDHLMQLINCNV